MIKNAIIATLGAATILLLPFWQFDDTAQIIAAYIVFSGSIMTAAVNIDEATERRARQRRKKALRYRAQKAR